MKKVFVFDGKLFDKESLEEKTNDELFDLQLLYPCNVYFFDCEEKYQHAMNNKMLFDENIVIFIDAN